MKKTVSFLLVFAIVFSVMAGMGLTTNASTNGHSQTDAVEWIKARGNEHWWQDVDNAHGCQCVDLTKAYYNYLGQSITGNAKDYLNTSKLPSGWWMDTTPAPGAVIVWGGNTWTGQWTTGSNGHVGLVYAVSGSNVYTVETNTGSTNGQGSAASAQYRTRINCNARFIHPDFSSATPTSIPGTVTDLRSERTVYTTSESVNFTWTPVAGAEEYWVYLWKDGVQLYQYNCGLNTSFTQAPSSSGKYTLIIRPINSVGANDSSPWYKYTVTNKVPDAVTDLKSEKSTYTTSEPVNFTWSSVFGAEEYWVYLWKDGVQLYQYNCGLNTSFTQAPSSPGNYTLIIRPVNSIGANDSSPWYKYVVAENPATCTHSYSSKITTAATCTVAGVETFTCSKCGNQYTQAIAALGHDYSGLITKPATCTEKGVKTFKCSRCTSSYTQGVSATGHSFVSSQEYCQNGCGTRNLNYVAPHTHSWDSGKVTTAATCTSGGVRTYTCSCGETKTETIPATGHSFVNNKEYCQNGCGTRNPNYVAPHTHHYQETVIYPDSTHLGYIEHTCSCGDCFFDSYTAPTGKLTLKHSARTANALKVTWNNVKTATGYQVQVSTKDGKKWDKYYNLKSGETFYTFKNLAAGNAYKYRVRFYIAKNGKNYYSPWSSTLTSPTLPTGTTLTKLTPAKKAFTAQWKKNATVTGYQVQYSLKSNFSGAKTITVKSPKTLKAVAKKLNAGKYYYVRIRTYKTISKVNYFSAWSKTYKVKTK